MPVKCEEYDQVCVLAVTGDLAGENAAALKSVVEAGIDQRHIVDFVLDMEKVPFIDSEGLEMLLWMRRRCEELFGQIKLVNLDEHCRKIMEITRLDHSFECCEDMLAALKTMRWQRAQGR
jgi:anti-anti-sigma factor